MKETISRAEYLTNPCTASSLPFWKAETICVPKDMRIVLDEDFVLDDYPGFVDTEFFKLRHSFNNLTKTELPLGFFVKECEMSEIAKHIADCYDGAPSLDEFLRYKNRPTYREDLWLAVCDKNDGQIVASGIAEIDPRIGEGILEWVQVSKEFRRKGLGKFVVCELVRRLQNTASFVTVSGEVQNPTNPLALYLACGFGDKAIWHILKR